MTTGDYDAVINLWRETPGIGINDYDDSLAGIRKYLERNPSSCFVAEDGGRLAGTILSGHDGRRGLIYHLAVHTDAWRRGIGRALVEASLDALRREGIAKAMLVVLSNNETGQQFWESLGFIIRDDIVLRSTVL